MRAVVLSDVQSLRVEQVPIAELHPHDVRLRVAAVGLCGTDFHIYEGHGNYNTDALGRRVPLDQEPQILGHEIVGFVEEVGSEVRGLGSGQRVVVDQGRNCSSQRRVACEYCVSGYTHQCEYYAEHGITGLPGGLAETLTIPAVNVLKTGGELSDAELALTEPLACVIHSMDVALRSRVRYGLGEGADLYATTLLITGAGPAGLLFVQYLRNVIGYEGQLLVSEPNPNKRALAEQFGATAFDPRAGGLVETVLDLTRGRRIECLIEASGSAAVLADVPGVIRKLATLLVYGHGHSGVDVSVLSNIQFKEPALLTPTGASGALDDQGRPSVYRRSLELLQSGRIRVAPLITHRYGSLEAVPAAFLGVHRTADYIKGVVELGGGRES